MISQIGDSQIASERDRRKCARCRVIRGWVYREKASGARADRPELLRMIADLQSGEVVIAEKIHRIQSGGAFSVASRRNGHSEVWMHDAPWLG